MFHFLILFFLLAGMFILIGRVDRLKNGIISMKSIIIAIVILAVAVLGVYYFVFRNTASPSPVATSGVSGDAVRIKNFSFDSQNLSVETGTKVTWTNNDSVNHTIVSDSENLLNSPDIAPGGTFVFTFLSPGLISYHCGIHPTMKGEIAVKN